MSGSVPRVVQQQHSSQGRKNPVITASPVMCHVLVLGCEQGCKGGRGKACALELCPVWWERKIERERERERERALVGQCLLKVSAMSGTMLGSLQVRKIDMVLTSVGTRWSAGGGGKLKADWYRWEEHIIYAPVGDC